MLEKYKQLLLLCSYHGYECLIYRVQAVARLCARNKGGKIRNNYAPKWLKTFSQAVCKKTFWFRVFLKLYLLSAYKAAELHAKWINNNYEWTDVKIHLSQVSQPVPYHDLHVAFGFLSNVKALDQSPAQAWRFLLNKCFNKCFCQIKHAIMSSILKSSLFGDFLVVVCWLGRYCEGM